VRLVADNAVECHTLNELDVVCETLVADEIEVPRVEERLCLEFPCVLFGVVREAANLTELCGILPLVDDGKRGDE